MSDGSDAASREVRSCDALVSQSHTANDHDRDTFLETDFWPALHVSAPVNLTQPVNIPLANVKVAPRFSNQQNAHVAVRSQGKILFLDSSEIMAVEAQGNYVLLRVQNGCHLLRESISVVSQKLERFGLLRIHRSVLVNKSYVAEIQPWPTGEYGLRLKGGKEYTVTRTFKTSLRQLADVWLGSETFMAGGERSGAE